MISSMDSIGKYVLEIILHQHMTLKLLKQTKLMQIQEDHSNPIRALNVDSLKVDSVVIQNLCFETEDNNSETASSKSVKKSSLYSTTKDIKADDQAIQTILLGLPEDIYAAVDSCETAQEIWLRVQQMMKGFDIRIQEKKAKNKHFPEKIANITDPTTAMNMALALMAKAFKLNYSTPTNNNQRISSNPKNRQIAQSGINMGQDRQMQMVRGNGGNQFRQYAGNSAGYNDVIGNQEVNANCILMANLKQASTSGTQTDSAPVYDSDGSAE
nr:hypothetical protein [Tanacetum cinerariifolium]